MDRCDSDPGGARILDSTQITGVAVTYPFDGRAGIITVLGTEREHDLDPFYEAVVSGLYAEAHKAVFSCEKVG